MVDVRSIVFASTKGGVGKTTTTANVGGLLASLGHRVLLIDADSQPALSSYFALETRAEHGLTRMLQTGTLDGCVSRTDAGCDIVVSDDPSGALPHWIHCAPDGLSRVKYALAAADTYDVVLVDTPGAVNALQAAAMFAADLIVCPVQPTMLAAREFTRGMLGLVERLKPMASKNLTLGPIAALLYMTDRTVDGRRIAETLREHVLQTRQPDGSVSVLDTHVPASNAYRRAATRGLPAHRVEKTRRGPSPSARETMMALVAELWPDTVATGPRAATGS